MPGKDGYLHSCDETKVEKGDCLLPLSESGYSVEEINLLWDFYVTRNPAARTKHSISLQQMGWKATQDKVNGYPALISTLERAAGIDSICFVRAKTIKDTLAAMGLAGSKICFTHPRAVLMQKASYIVSENERLKIESDENPPHCLLRHIRNALAHGGTYFYGDMMLLEDCDGKSPTGSILLPREALLSWMGLIDRSNVACLSWTRF